ncbi:Di-trans-poly-cis-decaprenylcistransferase-like protein [Akanthomyces lecanii RCEF 1005]|uniref:Alkyl transferase n=1 Tax=Akanthomyces lecanii RCEF 1005 TaxID=1081108 RepID=A0A168HHA4_CORDF|nr:Di-trans-poly-cis-decaprenylcistransferase-like protein [Akanthomyces lecanii RCEF 1005]
MSLYVFSVENFKRSDEEVDTILEIVVGGLNELVQLAHDLDASIRICGQRELISPRVLERLEGAAESTRHNQSAIVNICFAYASTVEMRMAIQCSVRERLAQEATASDTTFDTVAALDRNMYTVDSPPLDLLICTGSTHRLSDFLLWQCHQDTSIVFVKKAWPELSIPRVLAILIEWRQNKSPPPPTISKP